MGLETWIALATASIALVLIPWTPATLRRG